MPCSALPPFYRVSASVYGVIGFDLAGHTGQFWHGLPLCWYQGILRPSEPMLFAPLLTARKRPSYIPARTLTELANSPPAQP